MAKRSSWRGYNDEGWRANNRSSIQPLDRSDPEAVAAVDADDNLHIVELPTGTHAARVFMPNILDQVFGEVNITPRPEDQES